MLENVETVERHVHGAANAMDVLQLNFECGVGRPCSLVRVWFGPELDYSHPRACVGLPQRGSTEDLSRSLSDPVVTDVQLLQDATCPDAG